MSYIVSTWFKCVWCGDSNHLSAPISTAFPSLMEINDNVHCLSSRGDDLPVYEIYRKFYETMDDFRLVSNHICRADTQGSMRPPENTSHFEGVLNFNSFNSKRGLLKKS